MIEAPLLSQVLDTAPLIGMILLSVGVGFYAAYRMSERHIRSLEKFIEYLKKS